MIVIKEIIEKMDEELEGASQYIDLAFKYHEADKTLADMFYSKSIDEYKHNEELHAQIVRIIQAYRSKNGEPPKEMQAIYDWEHQKAINKAKEVKVRQEMYKKQYS